jgi:hypothetical protein
MRCAMLVFLCAAACGGSERAEPKPAEPAFEPAPCASEPLTGCMSSAARVCPGDIGYARVGGIASSDNTAAELSVPEPGTICMKGTLSEAGTDSWSQLVLTVDERANQGTCVLAVLDARALGIESLEFDLDQVPNTRMYLSAGVMQQAECDDSSECADGEFKQLTHDRQDLVLLQPGTNHAPLADFVNTNRALSFNASRIAFFAPRLEPRDKALDYAFCVSRLRFFDAAGRDVELPGL